MLFKKLLIILFVLPFSLFAENVVFKGNIPDYAGEKFTFLCFSNNITFTEEELCTTIVKENGDFLCSFYTDKTKYVFIRLGVYEAYIFAEPGKEYELLFPEKKEKSHKQVPAVLQEALPSMPQATIHRGRRFLRIYLSANRLRLL